MAWLKCALRGWHNSMRTALGVQVCRDCGKVGRDFEEMGFIDAGYVDPTRKTFSRIEKRWAA